MTSQLDLTHFLAVANSVPPHTAKAAFFHLVEEVGEVSVNLNRPEKAGESLVGEIADVLNCALDIYRIEYGDDFTALQEAIDKKCTKWGSVAKENNI